MSVRASGCSCYGSWTVSAIRPRCLAGWLAIVTRRECLRVRRAVRPLAGGHVPDAGALPADLAGTAEQELLAAERQAALREAFARLPLRCQRLIALLIEDPPVPYAEISGRLASRSGTSGPTAAAIWTSCAATRQSPA